MKSPIKASEINDRLLKINRQGIVYYRKVSEKIRALNLKPFLNEMLVGGRKKESFQTQETKQGNDASDPIKRSKLHRFRMKVKTIINNAYELE